MRLSRIRPFAAVLVGAVIAQACAGTPETRTVTARPAQSSSSAELEALYRARLDGAVMNVSEADVRFMTGMIFHHAQALVMAAPAPTHGASRTVQTLTARIINAQKDEIATMQQWLHDRAKPVPEVDETGRMVMGPRPTDAMRTPGMLTAEQMAELESARDGEFDRVFLTYMIQHHQGAVTMVHDLFATDGAAQDDLVFKIASDIQVDQITEIARMRRMLDELRAPRGGR